TELTDAFKRVHDTAVDLYEKLILAGCSPVALQLLLPMGFQVGFHYYANLRQHEFATWQRSKPDVNHSVRQTFLQMERAVRKQYPWWEEWSRANMEPAYIFARGEKHIPLPKKPSSTPK